MSSPVNARYKSRLFNFLNRKSLQWGTQVGTIFRQVKNIASWGAQIVLYLAYLSIQTGRVIGHQLKQGRSKTKASGLHPSSPASQPQLSPDTPTQKVLQAVEQWIDEGEIKLKTPSTIQGVAACINSCSLVLVTDNNQSLDILKLPQQRQLQKKIVWELVEYHRVRRLNQQNPPFSGLLPKFTANNTLFSGLTQSFWNLMHWVQRSPLAIRLNLFEEATLVKQFPASPDPVQGFAPLPFQNSPSGTLIKLDQTIAEIELHPLAPGRKLAQTLSHPLGKLKEHPNWAKLRATLHAAIDYFFGTPNHPALPFASPDSQSLPAGQNSTALSKTSVSGLMTSLKTQIVESRQKFTELYQQRSQENIQSFAGIEEDPFSIRQLLHAAVDYFFGISSSTNRLQNRQFNHQGLHGIDASQALPKGSKPSPWLSWNDLFKSGQTNPLTLQNTVVQSPVSAEFSLGGESNPLTSDSSRMLNGNPSPLPSLKMPLLGDPWLSWEDLFEGKMVTRNVPPAGNSILLPQELPSPNPPTNPLKIQIENKLQNKQSLSSILKRFATRLSVGTIQILSQSSKALVKGVSPQGSKLEHDPEWVETEAKSVGYIKHPLVQIVELLDGIILWLEEMMMRFWHWWRTKL